MVGEKVIYDKGPGKYRAEGIVVDVDEFGVTIRVTSQPSAWNFLYLCPSNYIYLSSPS